MSDVALILRRAHVSRISGQWQDEDYDVFDGDRDVGRIYLVHCADRAVGGPDRQGTSGGWGGDRDHVPFRREKAVVPVYLICLNLP